MKKYLLNWNDEYLDMMIVAGPLDEDAARQAMKETVTRRLVELNVTKDAKEAAEMYAKAEAAGPDDENYELHVSSSSASILYDSYEDRYQIVDYPSILGNSATKVGAGKFSRPLIKSGLGNSINT